MFADPWFCLTEWEKRGKVRHYGDAVWHARIMTYIGRCRGRVARTAIGDGYDRYQVELMAEELCHSPPWDRMEPRLRRMTRMLVRRRRDKIERVAEAQLAKTTLNAKQLQAGRPERRRRQGERAVPAGKDQTERQDGDRAPLAVVFCLLTTD